MANSYKPKKIGRYKIIKVLGRGGMGVVYLAKDPFIDREVAIKTTLVPPPKDPLEFDEYQQTFFNEARAAGKLTHRNIVSVFDAAVDLDSSYLVMEYVEGQTLHYYCRPENLLELNKVVNIIFQCAKALDYAHSQGIVHRDIKPKNILISSKGRPKISDFGIAAIKDTQRNGFFSQTGGSIQYSSPEQLKNEPTTAQSDIFSLGVVLYECLTGERPFRAENDVAMFYKITHEDPTEFRQYRTDLPESLERIVFKCLAKDLEVRYASGLQLAQALIASFDHLKFLKDEVDQAEKVKVLRKISFFKDFSASELTEVIRNTQWVRYETASLICREDEVDDTFFIIVAGEVVVRKRGRIIAQLKNGEYFGEMAYLGRSKRTASVLAATNTILMKIRASAIDRMSISTQLRFYRVFSRTLISRLAHTNELLTKSYF